MDISKGIGTKMDMWGLVQVNILCQIIVQIYIWQMMLFKKISQIMVNIKKGINLVMMIFITIFRSIIKRRIKDFMMFFILRWRVLLLMLSEHLQEVLILINWVIISRFLDLILWLTPILTYGSSKSIVTPV